VDSVNTILKKLGS